MRDSIKEMTRLIAEKDMFLVERKTSKEDFLELQSELLHVSRLNAMGQMTAAIAHELNQPLAAIANYVGAAKLTLVSTEQPSEAVVRAQEMIDKAQEQTLRAGEVIKKLRDMVEKRESVRSAENLEAIIRSAMSIVLFGSWESDIAVNINVAVALPAVLIDKVQIQQILFNLIRNSIEAMRKVETRTLDVTVGPGDPGFIEVTIRDTGIGMPTGVVARLFLPFVTTKDEGMGLGLMICQTLVEANGGRIWRVENISPGTAFRFCLPIAAASAGILPQVA